MTTRKLLSALLAVCMSVSAAAQDNKGTGPAEKSIKAEIGIKKQQRREARERRKRERQERKAIKRHHKRIQTKKVQKRMKESRQTAIRNNEHRREPFYKRWFRKKGKMRAARRSKD